MHMPQWIRRLFLRSVDEDPAIQSMETFREQWQGASNESREGLAIRHDLILQRLQDDFEERRSSLQGNFQAASVTLGAISLFAAIVALAVKHISLAQPSTKFAVIVLILVLWQVFGSYMPKATKAFYKFMDAGVHVVTESVPKPTPQQVRSENYVGEHSKRCYAESIIYALNVRNRIARRTRIYLSTVHLAIKVVLLIIAAIVIF